VARVLIVESQPDVLALLELIVARLGHEPVRYEAEDVPFGDVDVAIVEPGDGDGMEVAERLRLRGVPLVFASIFPPEPRTLAMLPVAFLVKPFSRHALAAALAGAIDAGARR
jgi:CheY-like chemotaxis protein